MNGETEIKQKIAGLVAEGLPSIKSAQRAWIGARVIEPRPLRLALDPDGKEYGDFWLATDHKDGGSHRVAFDPESDAFGLVVTLEGGIEWYMGHYGSFADAVESM